MDDERNLIKPYIDAYQITLENLGATGIVVRAPENDDFVLGNSEYNDPGGAGGYWIAHSCSSSDVRICDPGGGLGGCCASYCGGARYSAYDHESGVRPVLIIN